MPLGFFGNSSSSVKPQQLASQVGDNGASDMKGSRGTVIRLPKHTVTIERKLAEGGFAIVYLVSDKSNRHYALKRQFISEDPRQLEACKRECRIVSCLAGHKNIVEYVDHSLNKNRCGVHEYSLLTAYYKNSVLQLINERIMGGRCLSANEILCVLCDMCEAVARLHHSQTPVIHRDLKIENVLIDERRRGIPPTYVLCDFGSATTKVLSTETHSLQHIEDEIQRYTTLSYRAPEMVDLYSGRPIGTKTDIWALGVLLYKLCYFVLPFGESALAIQNCAYGFPADPQYPDELRAIIKILLESDVDHRPDIYQTACLAFEARAMRSPVGNLNKVKAIPLSDALSYLRGETHGSAPFSTHEPSTSLVKSEQVVVSCTQGVSVTSVNPRLRPKPSSLVGCTPGIITASTQPLTPQKAHPNVLKEQNSVSNPDIGSSPSSAVNPMSRSDQNGSGAVVHAAGRPREHSDLGFTDLDAGIGRCQGVTRQESVHAQCRDPLLIHASAPQLFDPDSNQRALGPTLRSSAFKPYSATSARGSLSARSEADVEQTDSGDYVQDLDLGWNPFTEAPFERGVHSKRNTMDDRSFGKCFDQLPRSNRRASASSELESKETLLDVTDPFGAAPFTPFHLRGEEPVRVVQHDSDSIGSTSDLRISLDVGMEDESDCDEVRRESRRRFSYEHFDGVGDNASSELTSDDDDNTKGMEERQDKHMPLSSSSSGIPLLHHSSTLNSCSSVMTPPPPQRAVTGSVGVRAVLETNPFANRSVFISDPLNSPIALPPQQSERTVDEVAVERTQAARSAPATMGSQDHRKTVTSLEAITAFISPREKHRVKIVSIKRKTSSSSTSSDESAQTDDSGAEMFSCSTTTSHKKKSSSSLTHGCYRSSPCAIEHSSASATVKMSPILKKCSGKRYGSMTTKRGSQGTLDAASFVNSSFQAEDTDTKNTSLSLPQTS